MKRRWDRHLSLIINHSLASSKLLQRKAWLIRAQLRQRPQFQHLRKQEEVITRHSWMENSLAANPSLSKMVRLLSSQLLSSKWRCPASGVPTSRTSSHSIRLLLSRIRSTTRLSISKTSSSSKCMDIRNLSIITHHGRRARTTTRRTCKANLHQVITTTMLSNRTAMLAIKEPSTNLTLI